MINFNLISLLKTSDKYFLYPVFISMIFAMILIGLFLFFQRLLPTQLPLFYSYSWGEQQLTAKINYLLLPGIITIITVINTILAWQIHPSQQVLRRIILINTIFINLILFIAGIKILSIFVF